VSNTCLAYSLLDRLVRRNRRPLLPVLMSLVGFARHQSWNLDRRSGCCDHRDYSIKSDCPEALLYYWSRLLRTVRFVTMLKCFTHSLICGREINNFEFRSDFGSILLSTRCWWFRLMAYEVVCLVGAHICAGVWTSRNYWFH
jgi:hypothetical protein